MFLSFCVCVLCVFILLLLFLLPLPVLQTMESMTQTGTRPLDFSSDPNLGFPSSTLPLNSLTLNSRSLSLKHAHRYRDRSSLASQTSEGLTPPGPTSTLGSASQNLRLSPSALTSRGSSLSYDSLLGPPPGENGSQRERLPLLGYQVPYLPLDSGGLGPLSRGPEIQRHSPHTRSPVFMGMSRQSPQPREPSPVRYDNLSKAMMASIQERRELEEREKLAHQLAHHINPAGASYTTPDTGVYDTPSRRSLPLEGLRGPPSRGPTPPAYGSREFLMSSAAYGYGSRMGLSSSSTSSLSRVGAPRISCSSTSSLSRTPRNSCSSTSSLSRAPRHTSGSPLQSYPPGGGGDRSLSPAYHSLERQLQQSPSTLPCSPTSYTTPRGLAFISDTETRDLPPSDGLQRHES